jgi:hypothetical protein
MDYGKILSKAWQIIWKHKVLWLFGILASCGSAGSGAGSNGGRFTFNGQAPSRLQAYFDQFSTGQWAALAVSGFLIILLLVVLAVFLSTIGRTAVIRGAQHAETGVERLGFGELFRGSLPYFWRVFGLAILIALAIFAIAFVALILGVVTTAATLGLAMICLVPLTCLLVPALAFVSIIVEQSTIAIVVENLGITDGLRRGWEVSRNNLWEMIVMGLILMVGIGWIGGFILSLPIFIILAPLWLTAWSESAAAWNTSLLISGLCMVAYLPVLVFGVGILRSYTGSAWTLTYLRLASKKDNYPAPVEELPSPS